MNHRCEGGHAASDLELRRKSEEERPEDPEKILVVDQRRSCRIIDLVEEAKVPKWKHNHRLGRIRVSRSYTLEYNQSAVAMI
jgi:hypothetical protein